MAEDRGNTTKQDPLAQAALAKPGAHGTEQMTAAPAPGPQSSAKATEQMDAAAEASATVREQALDKALVSPTLVDSSAPQAEREPLADDPTRHDTHAPWHADKTQLGEPPLIEGPMAIAPPAAPPVPFAPAPAPTTNMAGSNLPLGVPALFPRYPAPGRSSGSGTVFIVWGLLGMVFVLGSAIVLLIWLRSSASTDSSVPDAHVAPITQVEPEAVTPAQPAPVPPEPAVQPTATPRPATRPGSTSTKTSTTAPPTATTPPVPSGASSESPAATSTTPTAKPSTTSVPQPSTAPTTTETVPPTPPPGRRVPRRLGAPDG